MFMLKSTLRKLCEKELMQNGESGNFFMDRKSGGLYAAWFAAQESMICIFIEYKSPHKRIFCKYFAPVGHNL